METKVYNLELTDGEVRSIGSSRWLKKHSRQSICGFIGCMALVVLILWLFPAWEESHTLSIVGGILAFCSFVMPYLWWNQRMGKAGKKYLKGVSK